MPESDRHRERVKEAVSELERDGWRAIDLENKRPDAIASRDGKIVAIEILTKVRHKTARSKRVLGKGEYQWRLQGGWTYQRKREYYSMFDDVIFFTTKEE